MQNMKLFHMIITQTCKKPFMNKTLLVHSYAKNTIKLMKDKLLEKENQENLWNIRLRTNMEPLVIQNTTL